MSAGPYLPGMAPPPPEPDLDELLFPLKRLLVQGDCADLIARARRDGWKFDVIHADSPWRFQNAVGGSGESGADATYDERTLSDFEIAERVDRAYDVATRVAYLVFWIPLSKLADWMAVHSRLRWRYVSGGVWKKTPDEEVREFLLGAFDRLLELVARPRKGVVLDEIYEQAGKIQEILEEVRRRRRSLDGRGPANFGYHWHTRIEAVLLYTKGNPAVSKRIVNDWASPRLEHSAKSPEALWDLLQAFSKPDGAVLDLYCGENATLPLAAEGIGKRWASVELGEEPFLKAQELVRLAVEENVYPEGFDPSGSCESKDDGVE